MVECANRILTAAARVSKSSLTPATLALGLVLCVFLKIEAGPNGRLLIGLIDTGFDTRHLDLNRNGHTRILQLWDQRDSTRRNGPYNASAVYASAEIESHELLGDREGHGTAVASLICGDKGDGTDVDADLVCVCVPERSGQREVAAGIGYIRRVAESLRRPYIINLSIGFDGGAKDGQTDELEYAISNLLATDSLGLCRQIVTAAGNANYDSTAVDDLHTATLSLREAVALENRRAHARGHGPGTFKLNLTTTPQPADDSCAYELWYSASRPYTLSIQAPDQSVIVSPHSPGVWTPDPAKIVQKFGYVEIDNHGPVQGPGPEPPIWWSTSFKLRDDTQGYGPLMGGTWTVELMSGFGTWDAYVTAIAPSDHKKAILREEISNECNIEIGGNVPATITVGAFNPCDTCKWKTLGGTPVILDASLPGHTISHFSSRGPTRLGFDKPDIYAAGQCCIVALSSSMSHESRSELLSSHLITEDATHFIAEGTSFAAPQVTRVLARILSDRPCLKPDQLKHILIASSDHIDDRGKLAFLLNPERAVKNARQIDCK